MLKKYLKVIYLVTMKLLYFELYNPYPVELANSLSNSSSAD